MKAPRITELTLVFGAVIAVAAAILAVRFWQSRGVCTDSVAAALVLFLTLIGMILLAHRLSYARRVSRESERLVLLVMTKDGKKDREERPEIKGKMPDQTDH